MKNLKNHQLIEELKRRFDTNFKDLNDQEALIQQLVLVNEKLKKSEALKSNFLSNIKNEFNNPLASVLGMAQILTTTRIANPLVLKKVAHHIFNELSNLDFQLRNIFAAAELEAGEASLEIAEADVEALIQNTIDLCKIKSELKEILVKFKIKKAPKQNTETADITKFKIDTYKLQLILMNLMLNSIEFTQTKGKINITLQALEKSISITINDSGMGIPESDRNEIFNRFTQLSTGLAREHKGHGLGLAITKSLIELFNGNIAVNSKKTGSTFNLTIPEGTATYEPYISTNGNEFLFKNHEKF